MIKIHNKVSNTQVYGTSSKTKSIGSSELVLRTFVDRISEECCSVGADFQLALSIGDVALDFDLEVESSVVWYLEVNGQGHWAIKLEGCVQHIEAPCSHRIHA